MGPAEYKSTPQLAHNIHKQGYTQGTPGWSSWWALAAVVYTFHAVKEEWGVNVNSYSPVKISGGGGFRPSLFLFYSPFVNSGCSCMFFALVQFRGLKIKRGGERNLGQANQKRSSCHLPTHKVTLSDYTVCSPKQYWIFCQSVYGSIIPRGCCKVLFHLGQCLLQYTRFANKSNANKALEHLAKTLGARHKQDFRLLEHVDTKLNVVDWRAIWFG